MTNISCYKCMLSKYNKIFIVSTREWRKIFVRLWQHFCRSIFVYLIGNRHQKIVIKHYVDTQFYIQSMYCLCFSSYEHFFGNRIKVKRMISFFLLLIIICMQLWQLFFCIFFQTFHSKVSKVHVQQNYKLLFA